MTLLRRKKKRGLKMKNKNKSEKIKGKELITLTHSNGLYPRFFVPLSFSLIFFLHCGHFPSIMFKKTYSWL
jgi:hypothetical protein